MKSMLRMVSEGVGFSQVLLKRLIARPTRRLSHKRLTDEVCLGGGGLASDQRFGFAQERIGDKPINPTIAEIVAS